MTTSHAIANAPRRMLRSIVADRLRERGAFEDWWGWCASLYDRLLLRCPAAGLPFRRRLVSVRVAGTTAPIAVRMGTSDLRTVGEVFLRHEYAEVLARIRHRVNVVIDLGANIGCSVRLWQERFPGARIVAVEPDAENLAVCRRNVALRGSEPEVLLVEAAVAGRSRLVTLDRRCEEWSFRIAEIDTDGRRAGEEGAIPALTLPDILARASVREDVDLLKCDIEGAEAEVFAECGSWLHRIRRLVVEVHAPYGREQLLEDVRRGGGRYAATSLKRQRNAEVVLLES